MSLVYAKKSDEIGMCFMCASRVSTCECNVCGTVVSRYLMYLDIKLSGYACTRVYLLT